MAVNLEILVDPLSGNRLIDDYRAGAAPLAPFFPGHPHDPDTYRRKAQEVMARFGPDRLRAMAGAVQVPEPQRERLDAITRGDGFFVTTGQQPGLFGGPLYTVSKALSAIALASALEALLDRPVLALFWIASDDHDWDEANHTYVLDTRNTLRRIEITDDTRRRPSMGRRQLPREGLETALSELAEALPPSEFRSDLLERLRMAYAGATVAAGFARLMRGMFAELPLGFVDAQASAVRELGRPVIVAELERSAAHEAALSAQTGRLEAAGYGAQVPVLPGASNVFYEDAEGRERLVREDGGWTLRASKRPLSSEEVARLVEESPERFSPNVVLRPVVESAVFPTLAYVGGPGEVSYLGQTGCLFEAHGVGMPVVFPRLSVTLVEGKVRKVLDKFGVEVGAFRRPIHEVVGEVVREEVPEGVDAAVAALRRSIQEGYAALFEAAKSVDPTLKGPIDQARNEGFQAVAEVERKVRQHLKSQNETGLEQLEKAAVNLAPEGKPQERVLNVHQYMARYGPALLPSILERMEVRLDVRAEGWSGVVCEP